MKESAGVLLYRHRSNRLEVLLVHPGGPFWARKDEGAWSIPKGEFDAGESAEAAAIREFAEETGSTLNGAGLISLGSVRQRAGKVVHAWAVEGDLDVTAIRSNTFSIEWPPRSGRFEEFPEVDRAEWFDLDSAERKLSSAQSRFLERLRATV